eukprot:Awhi_evm1s14092
MDSDLNALRIIRFCLEKDHIKALRFSNQTVYNLLSTKKAINLLVLKYLVSLNVNAYTEVGKSIVHFQNLQILTFYQDGIVHLRGKTKELLTSLKENLRLTTVYNLPLNCINCITTSTTTTSSNGKNSICDHSLVKRSHYSKYRSDDEEEDVKYYHLLATLASLKTLNLSGLSKNISLGMFELLVSKLTNITSLNLKSCSNLNTLTVVAKHVPKLQSLDIRGIIFKDALSQDPNITDDFDQISQLKNLTSLKFTILKHAPRYLQQVSSLVLLKILSIHQDDHINIPYLFPDSTERKQPVNVSVLRNLPNLVKLTIQTHTGIVGLSDLAQLSIKELTIPKAVIDDQLFTEVGQLLSLNYLNVSGSLFKNLNALSNLNQLRKLICFDCRHLEDINGILNLKENLQLVDLEIAQKVYIRSSCDFINTF